MGYKARVQSLINHTDACSTGNKEAGLMSSMGRGVRNGVVKKKAGGKNLKSATREHKLTNCCGSN